MAILSQCICRHIEHGIQLKYMLYLIHIRRPEKQERFYQKFYKTVLKMITYYYSIAEIFLKVYTQMSLKGTAT